MSKTIEFEDVTDLDDLPEIDLAAELEADTPELASSGIEDSFEEETNTEEDEPGLNDDQGQDDRPKSKADSRAEAKMIVNTFDLLQLNIFQYAVYPNVILKAGDYQKVERSKQGKSYVIDEETQAAIDRWVEFEAKCKELPLNRDEKDRIIDPLSKVLHKWNKIEVSPEMTLIFVIGLILLPRLQPVFPLMFKKLDGLFK
jgi:hypothetical protein